MDNIINVQKQIHDNAEEVRDFSNSLKEWEEEMKSKEQELSKMNLNKNTAIGERALKHEEADLHKSKGNDFVKLGKWKEALEEYSISISLYPDDAIYYGNRSYCHMNLRNWEAAENDCDRALELKSDYVKVALRRAHIRRMRGNLQGAAKDYNFVLVVEPKNSTALKEYEDLYPELKKYFAEIGINLAEFTEMNSSLKTEEETKIIDIKPSKKKGKMQSLKTLFQNNIENKQKLEKNLKNQDLENKKIENYSIIYPESLKPPHLRSKLPLRRIKIDDVYSNMDDEIAVF